MAGRGSLRERSPGVWQLRVHTGTNLLTGKPRVVARAFRGPRADAEVALAKFLIETRQRSLQVSTFMTLNEGVLLHLETHEVDSTTMDNYLRKFNHDIRPSVVGRMQMTKVTALDLHRFYTELLNRGLSVSTVRQISAIISGTFKKAMTAWPQVGLVYNPARGVGLPKVVELDDDDDTTPSVAVVDEALAWAAAHEPKSLTALRLSAYAGGRRGETCALRVRDVEVRGEITFLHIRHAIVDISPSSWARGVRPKRDYKRVDGRADGPGLWMKDTKGHAKRRLALDPTTGAMVAAHLETMALEATFAETKLVDNAFLFSLHPDHSVPWRPESMTTRWHRLRAKLDQRGVRLHDLRHFNGTQLDAGGTAVTIIMKRLGHKHESTTRRYVHGTDEADLTAAMALGAISRTRP